LFYTLFIQGNFSKFHGFDKHEWLISSKVLNLFILPTKAATIFTVTLILRELKDRKWDVSGQKLRKTGHHRGYKKKYQMIKSSMAKSHLWNISISYTYVQVKLSNFWYEFNSYAQFHNFLMNKFLVSGTKICSGDSWKNYWLRCLVVELYKSDWVLEPNTKFCFHLQSCAGRGRFKTRSVAGWTNVINEYTIR